VSEHVLEPAAFVAESATRPRVNGTTSDFTVLNPVREIAAATAAISLTIASLRKVFG